MSPSSSRFEVVLFDFGGVFIDSAFPNLEAQSEVLGMDSTLLIELTLGSLDRDTDHPWHRVERGELAMLDARVEIMQMYREAGIEADPFVLMSKTIGPKVQVRDSVVECTRSLRAAGLKTGLVTNNAHEIRDRWRAMIPVDDLFDDVVDSSEVGVRKPNPAIYQLALHRLGDIDPRAAIFLDDLPPNVAVAEGIGMQGIVVETDPEGALKRLRSLVGG
jgi:putative hydrolase of the HAD superfamily